MIVGRFRSLLAELRDAKRKRSERLEDNYTVLERELANMMAEFEAMPYSDLAAPSERWSRSKRVEGFTLYFDGELAAVAADGTLRFEVVARGLPTAWNRVPVGTFYKRPDEKAS